MNIIKIDINKKLIFKVKLKFKKSESINFYTNHAFLYIVIRYSLVLAQQVSVIFVLVTLNDL